MRKYWQFCQLNSNTFTYFSTSSIFTGRSDLDLVAILLWRDSKRALKPKLWRASNKCTDSYDVSTLPSPILLKSHDVKDAGDGKLPVDIH